MKEKLTELKKARDSLMESRKFWNTNRLFLAWAFTASVLMTSGIELAKLLNKETNYPFIFGALFIFSLAMVISLNKIIDGRAEDIEKTYKVLDEEITKLESKK
jgi:hypothetical protein